jgi:hypothetical protein
MKYDAKNNLIYVQGLFSYQFQSIDFAHLILQLSMILKHHIYLNVWNNQKLKLNNA